MLLSEDQRILIQNLNNTKAAYEESLCIHNKLEKAALLNPHSPAISFNGMSINYSELNEAANALANLLISKKVNIEDFVVLYLDRRLELIISIFGILKAGAVYVPITTNFPKGRIQDIIDDVRPKVIITSKVLSGNIPVEPGRFIYIDDFLNTYRHLNTAPTGVKVTSKNLAYAIFTSGTTGKPKGVLIEHHSVLNRIGWMQKVYPIGSHDVLIQKTPITFDVSIWELFWWSFVGARLVLLPNGDEKFPEKLINCVYDNKVSVIHFVPSMFNTYTKFLNSVFPQNKINSIKWLFCSGEELYPGMVSEFYKINSGLGNKTTVINLYGPTEATVDVTYYTCSPNLLTNTIPIGKPIDNTQIFIVNEKNEIMPPNTQGELLIGGVNLARGYLNRENLTKEKFINLDVFGESVRAYKTGDIAFFNNDGDLIYKGRKDKQIKLRGFRIELGEIENVILCCSDISECACIVKDEKEENAHIVCFFITKKDIDLNNLKEFIKEKLPDYMIPSIFCRVDELPLSGNGKLDRNALLSKVNYATKDEKPKSLSEYERTLQNIWIRLFKRQNISPVANFFDLGGNSLLIVQLSILLNREFGKEVDAVTLMEYPTIRLLAQHLLEK